ncbi:sensor histidine kinase [Baaleninema sp.]|uniref:sensor histidine kinase n=1 Tax=Baaleninema sp. TaxID=3101197 RepID=UPI003CFFAF02
MQLSRLPTFSQLLNQSDRLSLGRPGCRSARHADRQWRAAVDALNTLLNPDNRPNAHNKTEASKLSGFVLSAPTPILGNADLLDRFTTWTIAPTGSHDASTRSHYCLPSATPTATPHLSSHLNTLSLPKDDPLTREQFCLTFASHFSLVMVRGTDEEGRPVFQFTFDPKIVDRAWNALQQRLQTSHPETVADLDRLAERFAPVEPHYKTVMQFSEAVLQTLPDPAETSEERRVSSATRQVRPVRDRAKPHSEPWAQFQTAFCMNVSSETDSTAAFAPDVELLQALAHEVRTPLSTIRTFTKMLLKRKDLAPDVLRWLESIDRECSEQIDRFGLIFKAVELETCKPQHHVQLTTTSLAEVVNSCIPRWQKQASRRSLKLDVLLPQKMPQVISDPNLLDRVLTGTVDRFTSQLPLGSYVQVKVMPAGHQLKLQLKASSKTQTNASCTANAPLKSIGQLLNFQPETGNISLNLSATKNLFHALGGKLIVRNRPQQGEELTIFLPLER